MIDWKQAAKSFCFGRNLWRDIAKSWVKHVQRVGRERDACLENLTATQRRCTQLLEELRIARAKLAYLESRTKHYPIIGVLLKRAAGE